MKHEMKIVFKMRYLIGPDGLVNPIAHEQKYLRFCMNGVFKDPNVISSTNLQEEKGYLTSMLFFGNLHTLGLQVCRIYQVLSQIAS